LSQQDTAIDFSAVLAAAVHDMKNSLCLLMQSIESLDSHTTNIDDIVSEKLATIHYEGTRLNIGLVQLLSLYRSRLKELPLNVDECFVDELVDEIVTNNQRYLNNKEVTLNTAIEEDLVCFLDEDLITLLLNDVLVNATRYAKSQILLKAYKDSNKTIFQVEDDGEGYPETMLKANSASLNNFDIRQGRTGLGLFFARMIASAHQSSNGYGHIELENGGELGGSIFRLVLP
jgi:K+-sensing histidine kinase KdpD